MDWQLQLITLYLEVCKHWQEGGWVQAQRYAPYADLTETIAGNACASRLPPREQRVLS